MPWLGRLTVTPVLAEDEVVWVKAFAATRHWHHPDGPLRVAQHPSDDAPPDVGRRNDVYERSAPGLPGLWCPWQPCEQGCCLVVRPHRKDTTDHAAVEAWLRWLIRDVLGPGAGAARTPVGERHGLTGGHRLTGVVVGEFDAGGEVISLTVRDNRITRRRLLEARPGDDWYGPPLAIRNAERRVRMEARQRRFAAALTEDAGLAPPRFAVVRNHTAS